MEAATTARTAKQARDAEIAQQVAEDMTRAVSLPSVPVTEGHRIGVLLISHGSRAPAWRRMLLDVHADAAADLLALPGVAEVRSAFMEYTEPSIATQLRAFDAAGIDQVIAVPLLLTISDHSFDDIPAICGQSDNPELLAELAGEKIEVYRPEAGLIFTPLLDFSDLVRLNLARRLRAILGRQTENDAGSPRTGLVLVGYGSADFDAEWHRFFGEIRAYAETELGIDESDHAWCGHLVSYNRAPTIAAIDGLLESNDRVVVMPIFVAFDPMFQTRIIGGAVERCSEPERVLYRGDAILPEPGVAQWVVEVTRNTMAQCGARA